MCCSCSYLADLIYVDREGRVNTAGHVVVHDVETGLCLSSALLAVAVNAHLSICDQKLLIDDGFKCQVFSLPTLALSGEIKPLLHNRYVYQLISCPFKHTVLAITENTASLDAGVGYEFLNLEHYTSSPHFEMKNGTGLGTFQNIIPLTLTQDHSFISYDRHCIRLWRIVEDSLTLLGRYVHPELKDHERIERLCTFLSTDWSP